MRPLGLLTSDGCPILLAQGLSSQKKKKQKKNPLKDLKKREKTKNKLVQETQNATFLASFTCSQLRCKAAAQDWQGLGAFVPEQAHAPC